jgi:adenylyltransferase/sulfurtransferase
MSLTDSELERYARHIVLMEVGGRGQLRLQQSRVAVVGAGGLGSPLLLYLAAAGVGHLTILDDDVVSLSNLQRQTLYTTADVGRPKVEAAAGRLAALNPHVSVTAHATRLTAETAHLLAGHHVIADGTDRFDARRAVNAAALAHRTPLVTAALGPFQVQVGTFQGHLPAEPCWACFAGAAQDHPGETCADQGILGAVAGIGGTLQALEVLRLLTGFTAPAPGRLLLLDTLTLQSRTVRVPKDPQCPACGATVPE